VTVVRILISLPLGLAFGSFMTVVVSRLPTGESVVRPRSRCPSCGTPIRERDNVPVVSWLLLRGHCRTCQARISPMYPLLEATTAALVVAAALRFDDVGQIIVFAPFVGLMPGLALIDLQHRIIPNRIVYPSLVVFPVLIVAGALFGADLDVLRAALGFLAYGGGLFILALISPRGMGMGDVKLAALIGLVLGSLGLAEVAVAAGVGILLGGVAAVVALVLGSDRKSALPFGPSLTVGAVVAAFWGTQIAQAYLNRIG
jgi:leader peptidase (prepilin peptidase) / N-methyltransferase